MNSNSAAGDTGEGSAEEPATAGTRRRSILGPASAHFPQDRRRSRSRESRPGASNDDPNEVEQQAKPDVEMVDETKQQEIQAIKALVEKELENLVSPELSKHIKKVTLELSSKIYALQRTKARLEKADDELRILGENRLPSGVKGVSIPFETPLLDTVCVEEETSFNVAIPAGKTLREAKSMIHMTALKAQKEIDKKIISLQRDELRKVTKKDHFVQRGLEMFKQQANDWAILDLDLDDDETDVRGISEKNLIARMFTIYKKTVDKIAADVKRKAEADSKKVKSKADLIAKLSRTPPADLLNQAIDDRIAAAMKTRKHTKPADQTIDSATLFVAAQDNNMDANAVSRSLPSNFGLPKNGTSPAKGGGKAGKGKAKGRGKGKGKEDSTAKSKGKGKNNQSSAVQSKGKGKKNQEKGRGKSKAGEKGSWQGPGRGKGYAPPGNAGRGRRVYQ